MAMQKIKVGDEVIVLAGSDKGKRGTVTKIVKRQRRHDVQWCALVEGINVKKKHVKPNPNVGEEGGIKEKEAPVDLSNLSLLTEKDNKPSRVGIKMLEGKKVRYLKKDGSDIDSGKGN